MKKVCLDRGVHLSLFWGPINTWKMGWPDQAAHCGREEGAEPNPCEVFVMEKLTPARNCRRSVLHWFPRSIAPWDRSGQHSQPCSFEPKQSEKTDTSISEWISALTSEAWGKSPALLCVTQQMGWGALLGQTLQRRAAVYLHGKCWTASDQNPVPRGPVASSPALW